MVRIEPMLQRIFGKQHDHHLELPDHLRVHHGFDCQIEKTSEINFGRSEIRARVQCDRISSPYAGLLHERAQQNRTFEKER